MGTIRQHPWTHRSEFTSEVPRIRPDVAVDVGTFLAQGMASTILGGLQSIKSDLNVNLS